VLILIITSGPEKGRVFELTGEREFRIGRNAGNISLSDRRVSKQHAALKRKGDQWVVKDSGSRHGTYHNQQRITGSQPLDDGDFIQVGNTVIVLAEVEDSPARADSAAFVSSDQPLAESGLAENVLAEKSVLLGTDSESSQQHMVPQPVGRFRSAPWLIAAAFVVIGLNVAILYLSLHKPENAITTAPNGSIERLTQLMDENHQQAMQAQARTLAGVLDALTEPSDRLAAIVDRLDQIPDAGEQTDMLAALLKEHRFTDPALSEQLQEALATAKANGKSISAVLRTIEQRDEYLNERLAQTEPILETVEALLAARKLDKQWQEALVKRLDAQLASLDALTMQSETINESLANLDTSMDLSDQVDALAVALTKAQMTNGSSAEGDAAEVSSVLADTEVQQALVDIRDLLEKRQQAINPETLSASLSEQVREAAVAEIAKQTLIMRTLLDRFEAADDLTLQLAELRETVETQPELVEQSVTRLLEEHNATDRLDQLAKAVDEIRQNASDDTTSQQLAEIADELDQLKQAPSNVALARTMTRLMNQQHEQVMPVMAEIAQALNDRPTLEEVEQTLAKAQQDAMAPVLEAIEAQPTSEVLAASLRLAMKQQVESLTPMLEEIATRMELHPSSDELDAALAKLREDLPADASQKLDQLTEALAQRPTSEQLTATVESLLATQGEAAATAIERLAEAVDAQPTLDEVRAAMAAVRASEQTEIHKSLASIVDRLDLAAQLDTELAKTSDAAESHLKQTRELLGDVLAEVRDRQAIESLQGQLEDLVLAKEDAAGSPEVDELLAELQDTIKQRDLASARMISAAERIDQWPKQTEELLQDVMVQVNRRLAALEKNPGQTSDEMASSDALARVLRDVQYTAEAGLRDMQQGGVSQGAPERRVTQVATGFAAHDHAGDDSMMELTKLEMAYRLAFETGKPITIGSGMLDPMTGKAIPGRVLDPAAAKAAGITKWRDWYLMDDFAERRRLQKKAEEAARDRESGSNRPIITLPDAR